MAIARQRPAPAKAGLQVRLAAMAYNLRRSCGLLIEQRA
jgi:hypothetical protein